MSQPYYLPKLPPMPNYSLHTHIRSRLSGARLAFAGNGTQKQWDAVINALTKAPAEDISKIGCLSVFNYHRVNKWFGYDPDSDGGDILGFASFWIDTPQHLKTSSIGSITIAGKGCDIEFTTLHELGHIVLGIDASEDDADNYAKAILGRAMKWN